MAEQGINYIELEERDQPTLELIDIEQPLAPGFDWLGPLQTLLWVMVILVLLMLLFFILRRLMPGLRLNWQLKQLHRQLAKQASVSKPQLMRLYQLWQLARRKRLIDEAGSIELAEQINLCCFGQASVSRETVMDVIERLRLPLNWRHRLNITQLKMNLSHQWQRWRG